MNKISLNAENILLKRNSLTKEWTKDEFQAYYVE